MRVSPLELSCFGDGTVILRPPRRRFHYIRTLAAAPAPPTKLRRAGATKAEDNSADDYDTTAVATITPGSNHNHTDAGLDRNDAHDHNQPDQPEPFAVTILQPQVLSSWKIRSSGTPATASRCGAPASKMVDIW